MNHPRSVPSTALPSTLRRMFSTPSVAVRQLGRIAFGAVMIAGAGWLGLALYSEHHRPAQPLGVCLIVGTWLCALAAATLVRVVSSVARWSPGPPRWFAASIAIPTVGIALLGPLTVHLPFGLLLSMHRARDFDDWVTLSILLTGPAHLVLAALGALRACQLVAGKRAVTPQMIFFVTLVVSWIPLVVLWRPPEPVALAIVSIVVSLTGLPFLFGLHWMAGIVEREREAIAALPAQLPRAITLR